MGPKDGERSRYYCIMKEYIVRAINEMNELGSEYFVNFYRGMWSEVNKALNE